ncbi:MAG: hypothetical protein HZB67_04295 [Candidatus Aenigmarchaeota archaeon]|nr:hypothetical protein [Candidatus Aenigmarchaeota archaeon]
MEKARKDLERAYLTLHFGGEIIGLLYYTIIKGNVIPSLTHGEPDYRSMGLGLAVYATAHVPALFLKGLSMTQEENTLLAKKFERYAEENRQKGRKVSAWLDGKMSKMHHHFADKHEKYDNLVARYNSLRERVFG